MSLKLAATLNSVRIPFRQFFNASQYHTGKMVKEHHVEGYEKFTKLVEELENTGEIIHVMFSGGKDESGKSWCPYCNEGKWIYRRHRLIQRICLPLFPLLFLLAAEPVIKEEIKKAPENSHFILAEVGDRP